MLFSHRQLEISSYPQRVRLFSSVEPHAGGAVFHLDVAQRHHEDRPLASWSSIILFPQYGVSQYESSLFVGTKAALPAGQYGCWGSCSTTSLRPTPAAMAVDQRVAVRRVTVAARVIDLEHPLMAKKGRPSRRRASGAVVGETGITSGTTLC